MNLGDHLSIHRYWVHGGPELDFSDDEYYALLTEAELETALGWFAATPAVREVILTGGDPLMLVLRDEMATMLDRMTLADAITLEPPFEEKEPA